MATLDNLTLGVDFKRCDKCSYRSGWSRLRDHLLVVAAARAAYMDADNMISLPGKLEGEEILSEFISKAVDSYIMFEEDTNFDEYIETRLAKEFKED